MKTYVVLAAAVLLATACGGPKGPTAADGKAAATAINLIESDLPPGFTSSPAEPSGNDDSSADQLTKCVGASTKKKVSDANSDDFNMGTEPLVRTVSSEVAVASSTSDAQKYLKAFQSSKAKPCLESSFTKAFKDEVGATKGASFGEAKVSSLPAPEGADGGFGFTIEIPFTLNGTAVPIELNVLGFVKKHTEVTLQTICIGSTFSPTDLQGLTKKLVTRANASAA